MPARRKNINLRQSRNRPKKLVVLPPEKSPMVYAPKLPDRPGGGEWSEAAQDIWGNIWKSPQASQFMRHHVPFLTILVVLMEEFAKKPNASLAREIRAWAANFGLAPDNLRGLDWVVPGDEPKPPEKRTTVQPDRPDARQYLDGIEDA